jgi:CheY-like chemotaxis protein
MSLSFSSADHYAERLRAIMHQQQRLKMARILLVGCLWSQILGRDSLVVLLVDDDRKSREALAEFLSLKGHVVQCAANGSEALRLIDDTQTHPELIFLDLMMPVLDGWGFLAERAKNPLLADVPVVIMTGSCDVTQKAKEAGAVAVVRKPLEPQTLLGVIEHFVEGV